MKRQPEGIPAGGQFAPDRKGEPSGTLAATGTLQTGAPLDRLPLTVSARSTDWFRQLRQNPDEVDMDQDYQRGHVWGKNRQRLLIKSLMERVPIPAIIVNNRMEAGALDADGALDYRYAIVDGKQRATAIGDFMTNELDVPASWFLPAQVETSHTTDDGEYVSWDGLTTPGRRFFSNANVPVAEGQIGTLEGEKDLFDRINFGGVPQGESDL